MNRILNIFCVIACVLCVQSPGPKVELSLIVTDKANKPVTTIGKDEISVIEDKIAQTVLSVEPDERPVDCVLVLDRTGSFRRLLGLSVEAATRIIVNRRPTDEISLETFVSRDKINTLHNFTTDGDALIAELNEIYVEGGLSAVVDALYVAAEQLAKHNRNAAGARRKAIVIITDGEDRKSSIKVEQLTKFLRDEGIQVFILGIVEELEDSVFVVGRNSRERAKKLLETVADESGGRVLFAKDKSDLLKNTDQVINHLRAQFRLTYQSTSGPSKTGFRKVEAKLISPSGEKRNAIVPRGYYVGPIDVPAKP